MKTGLFVKLNAIVLSICLLVCAVSCVQMVRVYASEQAYETENQELSQEYISETDNNESNENYESNESEIITESEPETYDYYDEVDPFDYNLTCYTPNLSFGTVYEGDYIDDINFAIVNIGSNTFPLTWDEFDSSTAFYIMPSIIGDDTDIDPGDQISFIVGVEDGLKPGKYSARYVFYSANDIRQHHIVQVNVSLTVKAAAPYITSIEVTPDRVTVPTGKSYQFRANVNGGNNYNPNVIWSVTGNYSSGTKVDSSGTLNVASDETASTMAVIATSVQDSSFYNSAIVNVQSIDHLVSIEADPSSGGAIVGGGAVRNGGSVKVSASPNNNYKFLGWYEGASLLSTSPQFTLNDITSDRRLVARFERATCYVKTRVNNSDGGTITESGNVNYGGNYTITAKAKNGYSFAGFVEDNKTISTANSIQLNNITSDRVITAVFNRVRYTVNINVSPQDTGTFEGAGTYDRGSKVVIKYRAYDGYEFAGWILNGQIVSYDNDYVIKSLENDLNFTASFRKKAAKTFKIGSAVTNEGGAIIPSGEYTVQQGGSVTYNIVPVAGYKIRHVYVDGQYVGAIATYTFNNVGASHTIAATFDKIETAQPKQSNTQKSVSETKQTASASTGKTTEYNEKTASQGAVPEQTIISEDSAQQASSLDADVYAEDTYIPAQDNESMNMLEVQSYTNPNSIIARHGLDEETVRNLIHDNSEMALLKEAYESGMIRVTVNNSYADNIQETSEGLYISNPTITNFETVVSATLTEDEKLAAFAGSPILFNVSITDNSDIVDDATKDVMKAKIGYKPVSYFDFFIMKSIDGNTEILTRTGAELVVVLPIPEKYRKAGRNFSIIRNHNGTVDILADLDDNPDTITFKTDKFSEYSIAYQTISTNQLVLRVTIIMLIALVLAAICYTNLWIYRHRARKERNNFR